MANEFRQHWLGLIGLLVFSLVVYGLIRAGSSNVAAYSSATPRPKMTEADQHMYAAIYTTTGGYSSTLGLNNATNHPIAATVTLYNEHGAALTVPPITLDAHKNQAFDIADWVRNADGFEEGSLEVLYHDISMALGAQETITDANHSLSFDVHLQEPMDFMSSRVDGLWWALDDNQTDAEVFIANTRATQTVVTPIFYIGGAAQQGDAVTLNGRESNVIDIRKSLQSLHLSTPAVGGISLSYTNGQGALAMVGVIRNAHNRFSTTMRFSDQASQMSTHLHGANILIGKPAPDSGFASTVAFTPHVIMRNTTDQPVQITSRIRYTSNDQSNNLDLGTLMLAPNAVRELDLRPAINAIANSTITDSGIEIDHNGTHGAVMAYAASVDQSGSAVFDVPVKDPTSDMGFKGGSYPWNIEGDNRAVLHVKNVDVPGDGQKRQFMVKLYFDGGEYNFPLQQVDAGQTAEIDIKHLRDDQVPDSLGNRIPLNITGGQLNWYGRINRGAFIGRLVQYSPLGGISASFSCVESCVCSPSYGFSWLIPSSHDGQAGDTFGIAAWEEDVDCNGNPFIPYIVPEAAVRYDYNPFIVNVYQSTVFVIGWGNTDIQGSWTTYINHQRQDPNCETANPNEPCPYICDDPIPVTASGDTQVRSAKVDIQLNGSTVTGQTVNVIVGQEMNLTTLVQPSNGTVTNSQWTVPGGNSDRIASWVVNFTDNQHPTSATVNNLTSLNGSSVDLYWISGGNGRTVQYAAKVNGKPVSAQVTFNVQRPTPAQITVTTATSTTVDSAIGVLAMHLGDVPPSTPGLAFSRTLTLPPNFSSGSTQWVQVFSKFNGGNNIASFQQDGLDDIYPYDSHSSTTDSPFVTLPPSGLTSTFTDYTATMWLMFKPLNVPGTSIWVPLRQVTWSWAATATFDGLQWTLASHTDPQNLSDRDSTTYPTWTRNAEH